MAWSSPATRSTGDLITAAIWNQDVVDNVQYVNDNLYGEKLYDSGWFAVTVGTTYTKAHGLGVMPRLVLLYWASSATPATAYLVGTVGYSSSSIRAPAVYSDTTNVYARSGNYVGFGTIQDILTSSGGGYWRLIAIA